MLTLAIANNKGGSGKTTVAVHIAAGAARVGRKVLLVDLDPQGNATSWLLGGMPPGPGSAEALAGKIVVEAIRPVDWSKHLAILPATATLGNTDLTLASEVAGETLLRRALARVKDRFDMVVLDCPPNLGLTVLSALSASDGILVPVRAAFLDLAGLSRLQDIVDRVVDRLNAKTRILGVVLFATDPREGITREVRDLLHRKLGDLLFQSEVRVSTAAKSLPAHKTTAWHEGLDSRGKDDYLAILKEMKARLRKAMPSQPS